jgi:hypothetical protein
LDSKFPFCVILWALQRRLLVMVRRLGPYKRISRKWGDVGRVRVAGSLPGFGSFAFKKPKSHKKDRDRFFWPDPPDSRPILAPDQNGRLKKMGKWSIWSFAPSFKNMVDS